MNYCPAHGLSLPCTSCAADHLTGDHHFPIPQTCPRCTTAQTTPTTDTARAAGNDLED